MTSQRNLASMARTVIDAQQLQTLATADRTGLPCSQHARRRSATGHGPPRRSAHPPFVSVAPACPDYSSSTATISECEPRSGSEALPVSARRRQEAMHAIRAATTPFLPG
jgi:hypothetical protein